jgi:hypothetical protein
MATRSVIAAAAAALALAGCAVTPGKVDKPQIRSVIQQFAEADGPEACKLLSPTGLVDVYGGFSKPVAVARQECLRRSTHFKGERVRVEGIMVENDSQANVSATNEKGTIEYTVRMVRLGPSWRIDNITESRAE